MQLFFPDRFASPQRRHRPWATWLWNVPAQPALAGAQMRRMDAAGLGGAVIVPIQEVCDTAGVDWVDALVQVLDQAPREFHLGMYMPFPKMEHDSMHCSTQLMRMGRQPLPRVGGRLVAAYAIMDGRPLRLPFDAKEGWVDMPLDGLAYLFALEECVEACAACSHEWTKRVALLEYYGKALTTFYVGRRPSMPEGRILPWPRALLRTLEQQGITEEDLFTLFLPLDQPRIAMVRNAYHEVWDAFCSECMEDLEALCTAHGMHLYQEANVELGAGDWSLSGRLSQAAAWMLGGGGVPVQHTVCLSMLGLRRAADDLLTDPQYALYSQLTDAIARLSFVLDQERDDAVAVVDPRQALRARAVAGLAREPDRAIRTGYAAVCEALMQLQVGYRLVAPEAVEKGGHQLVIVPFEPSYPAGFADVLSRMAAEGTEVVLISASAPASATTMKPVCLESADPAACREQLIAALEPLLKPYRRVLLQGDGAKGILCADRTYEGERVFVFYNTRLKSVDLGVSFPLDKGEIACCDLETGKARRVLAPRLVLEAGQTAVWRIAANLEDENVQEAAASVKRISLPGDGWRFRPLEDNIAPLQAMELTLHANHLQARTSFIALESPAEVPSWMETTLRIEDGGLMHQSPTPIKVRLHGQALTELPPQGNWRRFLVGSHMRKGENPLDIRIALRLDAPALQTPPRLCGDFCATLRGGQWTLQPHAATGPLMLFNRAGYAYVSSAASYTRDFRIDPLPKKLLLHLSKVHHAVDVLLGDTLVKRMAIAPFEVDLTPALKRGLNTLTLCVYPSSAGLRTLQSVAAGIGGEGWLEMHT